MYYGAGILLGGGGAAGGTAATVGQVEAFYTGGGAAQAAMADGYTILNVPGLTGAAAEISSAEAAYGASGTVHVYLGNMVRSASIFMRIELPILLDNPAVTNIVIHALP
jgi:hypothetical protein